MPGEGSSKIGLDMLCNIICKVNTKLTEFCIVTARKFTTYGMVSNYMPVLTGRIPRNVLVSNNYLMKQKPKLCCRYFTFTKLWGIYNGCQLWMDCVEIPLSLIKLLRLPHVSPVT